MPASLNLDISLTWMKHPVVRPNASARDDAIARQSVLTKPPGALGRLEEKVIRLATLQGTARPRIDRVHICVFAGDHGVAEEGISAFPQAVTAEMVKNFASGGAAICVVARSLGAGLEVINLGTAFSTGKLSRVKNYALGPGTANFTRRPAMNRQQLIRCLCAGRDAVVRAQLQGAQLFIGGEMGIGNTTAATALACSLLGEASSKLVGPGTGLNAQGMTHKTKVIEKGLQRHLPYCNTPLSTLRRLGGFEIAALTGCYIACAQSGLPALVDGFISTVAALVAVRLCPAVQDWLLFAHTSAEPGHQALLKALNAHPLLDLGMRLGEGSGAAVAVPILRAACALHDEMATFAEAAVSEKL